MELAVALVIPLAKVVLPQIVSEFKAKLKKPLPCKEDVEKLGDELRLIIANIKDHEESSHGRIISHVQAESVNQLRTLAYKIEDCTESFLRQVMSDDGRETKDTSVKFGRQIKELLASAEKWNEGLKNATSISGDASTSAATGAPNSAAETSFSGEPVGMVEPVKELKKLVAEANVRSERKLKVISIVGFGGLGKTLLAKQVFDHKDEDNKFDLRVWVRADDKNAHQLLEDILKKVRKKLPSASNGIVIPQANPYRTFIDWLRRRPNVNSTTSIPINAAPQDGQGNNGDQLVRDLKLLLENKRYLVVIIDMREKEQWCGIKLAFTGTSEIDSRIIVTTTKQPVAKGCSDNGGYVYKMGSLTGTDPRTLFLDHRNLQLPDSSKVILKKCDGLPLALICLSENCKGELDNMETRSEEALKRICGPQAVNTEMNGTGNSNTPTERMRRMLLSSYQDLPNSCAKVCLLYLCMFPPHDDDDDYNVRKNSVIRRLLAEGLAQDGDIQAVNDLETLIDHCVLQSTEVSNSGKTKRCKVPGIVLEYTTRMAHSKGFVTVWNESQTDQPPAIPPAIARRLSIQPKRSTQMTLPVEESNPKVRTLVVFGNKDEATTLSNKDAIAKCELLRVLDLEGCGGLDRSDIKNFCLRLLLLKYLSLGASITEIPKSIRKLQVLETLDLRKTKIDMVPLEVITLPKLKHLLGKFQLDEDGIFRKQDFLRKNKKVRQELVKFLSQGDSKLEMLSGFVTGSTGGFPQLLIHMANLRKVKIWCDSTADGKNLDNLSQGIQNFLRHNGRSLSIDITDCPKILSVNFLQSLMETGSAGPLTTPTPSSVYTSSTPLPSLYSFKLHGQLYFESPGIKGGFPDFLTQLDSITELCLCFTNLSPTVMQAGLNRLKNPTLKYLKLVEKKLGTLKLSQVKFTCLVRICLVAEKKMKMVGISDGALPSLVSLHVLCEGLDGLSGIDIGKFEQLKEVGLHYKLEDGKKALWETNAKRHINWPNIVLVDPPKPKGS